MATQNNVSTEKDLCENLYLIQVELGYIHSAALTSEGRVFTWGSNNRGQLGDGTTTDINTPTEITSQFGLDEGETITGMSLGGWHSSAITSEGRAFTWGYNYNGQLGDGTAMDRNTPTEITSQFDLSTGETITSMSLGRRHSLAITSEGRVFTWGSNSSGQLGNGTRDLHRDKHSNPTEITNQFELNQSETITNISLGGSHSSAITSEGRVFTWGQNGYGQLGDTIRWEHLSTTPMEITSQFDLTEGETVTSMSLGYSHSSAITSEGRVFTWGQNENGELGDGTTTYGEFIPTEITSEFSLLPGETITSISFGSDYSSAISSKGKVFTWGRNSFGQLGGGIVTERSRPRETTYRFDLAEGEIVTSMSLGCWHSSAITSEGRIFAWGNNENGQLGDGTTTDRTITEITNQFCLTEE